MNKRTGKLNKDIWTDIDEFILHWDILKNRDLARKSEHPLEVSDQQWMSLASFHDWYCRCGDTFIVDMIKKERKVVSLHLF